MKIGLSSKHWISFVDISTIAWLGLFIIGFLSFDTNLFCVKEQEYFPVFLEELTEPFCLDYSITSLSHEIEQPLFIANWAIWIVFVIDLSLKFIHQRDYKIFVRKHWMVIILLIPFF